MSAKNYSSDRKRSRPVEKPTINTMIKRNKIMFSLLIIVLLVVVSGIGAFFILNNQNNEASGDLYKSLTGSNTNDTDGDTDDQTADTDNPMAIIDTSKGKIKVELYKDKVPNTVDNFIKLAKSGFYEGLVFHRVIDDFMIQGGGFKTDGTNKESPYGTINLEINSEVRHVDGAIAMARTNDPNSATSQFYICDGAQHGLDDSYAAFGLVTDGMNVVRDIASVETTVKHGYYSDWPVNEITINSITIEE